MTIGLFFIGFYFSGEKRTQGEDFIFFWLKK